MCQEWYFIINDNTFWKFQCLRNFEANFSQKVLQDDSIDWRQMFIKIYKEWGGTRRITSKAKSKKLINLCNNPKNIKRLEKMLAMGVDVNFDIFGDKDIKQCNNIPKLKFHEFDKKTSMHVAVKSSNIEAVKLLLKAGFNLEKYKTELIQVAVKDGNIAIADLLKKWKSGRYSDYLQFRAKVRPPKHLRLYNST